MSGRNGPFSELPEELEHALRRATDRTFVALTSLRKAVRQHVRNERANGNDLHKIQIELRAIVARALDGIKTDGDGQHDGLAAQMMTWSETFYTER